MSLYLAGGSVDQQSGDLWDDFCADVNRRGNRIALFIAGSPDESATVEQSYTQPILQRLPQARIETCWITDDAAVDLPDDFEQMAGVVVAAGWTPIYADALVAHKRHFSRLVRSAIPYLGFSAGAMIVGNHVIAGGWHHRGRKIAPEVAGEGSSELDIRPGLGLIGPAIETHADTQFLIGRAMAAIEAFPIRTVAAIDEDSYMVVETPSGRTSIRGAGYLTWIIQSGDQWAITRQTQPNLSDDDA